MKRTHSLALAGITAALLAVPGHAATINTTGSAVLLGNGSLQMTSGLGQGGGAWYADALSTTQSFSTTFSFSLARGGNPMADGIAFALQNHGTDALGWAGGDIGYGGLGAVGSVIQTWYNNHVGLDATGSAYNAANFAPAFMGGAALITGTETVSYDAAAHVLAMTGSLNLDGTEYAISDSMSINLADRFGATMYAGYTGGTGGSWADQRVFDYRLSQQAAADVPEPASLTLLGLGLAGLTFARRRHQG